MRKSATIVILCLAALFMVSGFTYAAGIGFYGNVGGGNMIFKKTDNMINNRRGVSGSTVYTCGLIADTNLGTEKAFNYRIKAGYDFQKSTDAGFKDLTRITITHIFGAALFQNNILRIWLGPQIGCGYFHANYVYPDIWYGTYDSSFSFGFYHYNSTVIKALNIHFGMSLGVNINIGEDLSLPFEGGFRYHFNANFTHYKIVKYVKDIFSLRGPEGYISFGVMCRFNESPQIKEDKKDNV